ncbi:glutaredoxin family protein [Halieaceae bacterium IMCC14734]|uniref:Glutaredoxin family protein n=1 Tax=Candidatus Litorirhabdus singularis TaxID=2518993 RepID=A0ABT3TJ94_9GAMM|nr:glutaredoxin family protein [Candidatus Litorirhabdus singularis]MCX2981437.1 glutaredoxin family protein [Candidatus Litorirhabdus singularis]
MSVATTSDLTLYSTSACHLCEQALELLQPWLAQGITVTTVDISADDALFERYGWLIPVLRRGDGGAELNWPFTPAQIAALLQAAVPSAPSTGD